MLDERAYHRRHILCITFSGLTGASKGVQRRRLSTASSTNLKSSSSSMGSAAEDPLKHTALTLSTSQSVMQVVTTTTGDSPSTSSSSLAYPRFKEGSNSVRRSSSMLSVDDQLAMGDAARVAEGSENDIVLACESSSDLLHWLSAIRSITDSAHMDISHYHPGIWKRKRWTCCREEDQVRRKEIDRERERV